jgi:predicted transcriptional regulator
MRAKPAYRDRDETDVAILDVLAERQDDGMTVFELRAEVETDIDTLEDALARLKGDDLIETTTESGRTVILPSEHAIGPEHADDDSPDILEELRKRLPF